MDNQIPAYQGPEAYVFVCYAHKDAGRVYPDLKLLDENQINVWYDEGIPAGRLWRAEIAAAIEGAKKFLFFISDASINSTHCLREVDYALTQDVEVVPVYLDQVDLPAELALVFSRVHALHRRSDTHYARHLIDALQSDGEATSTFPVPSNARRKFPLRLAGLAGVLLLVLLWQQSDRFFDRVGLAINESGVSTAWSLYSDGVDLLKHWYREDNLEKAIGLFREAIAQEPDNALAFARLGDALLLQYGLSGDESLLEDADRQVQTAVRLNADLAPVQIVLGRLRREEGAFDAALAALETARRLDPNNASAHEALGRLYEINGRFADAERAFIQAKSLDSDDPSIRHSYANFLFARGRFDDAVREWEDAVRIDSDHWPALVGLGAALDETDRLPEAIEMYERAIKIHPHFMAYSNLGTAYTRAGRYDEAERAYGEAIKLDKDNWLPWGNLAYVYLWENGMDEQTTATFETAIRLAEDARARSSRDPYVNIDLANYYARVGNTNLAYERMGTALVLSSDSAEIVAYAAAVFEILGDRADAIDHVCKALGLGYTLRQFRRSREMGGVLDDPELQCTA